MNTISRCLPDYFSLDINHDTYALRAINYPKDLALIHQWMNLEHIAKQWHLDESIENVAMYLEKALADDHQRPYIMTKNNMDIAYIEIYEGYRDRLARYYDADIHDMGWHQALANVSARMRGVYLTYMAILINEFIFRNTQAKKIVGEPNSNIKAYFKIAESFAYMIQKDLIMPEKKAVLYFCEKDQFYNSEVMQKFKDKIEVQ
ncbi:acetyltransferase [Acinetobacter qingfengensis]|uniref:Acyltransferase MbtK/IucB-like conserved domain-containing protein n=1 Tax=Acinetobacter qingfengensis TaxID=1262585 RepID=A0A1E7R853_9GAMM|nr:GNAT family N-acetyltransferase [Acinetobacter qingfengensis]KAA8734709.1 acetyltransferase [Acinetobacter qingfengensis]OEY95530.1 hypothetical protein BJI46_12705 [Acinetobacter qingfengensis]